MKHLKLFENYSESPKKYGYFDMSNAYTNGILEDLDNLKIEAGNYISFWHKYDPMSNFIEIEVMGDNWLNKITDIIEKHEGVYEGWENKLTDDALSISPMKFH